MSKFFTQNISYNYIFPYYIITKDPIITFPIYKYCIKILGLVFPLSLEVKIAIKEKEMDANRAKKSPNKINKIIK